MRWNPKPGLNTDEAYSRSRINTTGLKGYREFDQKEKSDG